MAIYRSNTNRSASRVVLLAIVAALVGGVVVGRLTAPDLSAQLAIVRSSATPIAASLEVIRSEYPELVNGGPDTGGATGSLARVRETFDSIRASLEMLDPDATAIAAAALEALEAGVAAKEPAEDVNGRTIAFAAALDAALGIPARP